MGRLLPLFFLADLALMAIALIDCLSVQESQIRALPRIAWVLLILLFSPVGGIAWFVAGRPLRDPQPQPTRRPGDGSPEAERLPSPAPAPDDDPEFLRRLSRQQQEDRELLRMWEADLRRREEELRRRDTPSDDDSPQA